MQLDGIHVALITPFAEDGSVDDAAFAALIEDQLRAGMHGVIVGGGTGEGFALDAAEARRILAVAVETVDGSVPITMQIGALSTRQTVANAEHAASAGAHIGLMPPPFGDPVSEDELVEHYAAVARVGLPLMIYHNPGLGVQMPPQLIARLAEIDGVDFLKDSSEDLPRLTEISRIVTDALQVLHGKDTLALAGFCEGLRASVWGAPNATPEACLALHRLVVQERNLLAARQLWASLFPVLRFFENEGYVATIKAAVEFRGLSAGSPRLPSRPLAAGPHAALTGLLDQLATSVETVTSGVGT